MAEGMDGLVSNMFNPIRRRELHNKSGSVLGNAVSRRKRFQVQMKFEAFSLLTLSLRELISSSSSKDSRLDNHEGGT